MKEKRMQENDVNKALKLMQKKSFGNHYKFCLGYR